MEALYDSRGQVYAWLDQRNARIMDRGGRPVALIRGDKVHGYNGRHLGWWDNDHLRDSTGSVALYKRGARGLGVIPPLPALPPLPPMPVMAPLPTIPALPPLRPFNRTAWANRMPF